MLLFKKKCFNNFNIIQIGQVQKKKTLCQNLRKSHPEKKKCNQKLFKSKIIHDVENVIKAKWV